MVNHEIHHPNGSVAHANWGQDKTLHVAAMFSNPYRWHTRQALFNNFRRHMAGLPNIKLYVGELAYHERNFEVTSIDHPLDFQWRTQDVLWHKENVLNQVVSRFDRDWQYGAYIDGDMFFNRHDLGLETIHQLQLHDWVQMFSSLVDLGPDNMPVKIFKSFARAYLESGSRGVGGYSKALLYEPGKKFGIGATGGAWAFRRKAFDTCGGLLDTCILGSGDWHMSYGLIGERVAHPEIDKCGKKYVDSILAWQARAAAIRKNIGCVDVMASHFWHSSRHSRGYGTRWRILRDNDYDPRVDIYRDSNGIYQLDPGRMRFRDDIRHYFMSRVEDSLQLYPNDEVFRNSI